MAIEDAARAAIISEMIAEGIVESDGEVLTHQQNGREFMVELRVLNITRNGDER